MRPKLCLAALMLFFSLSSSSQPAFIDSLENVLKTNIPDTSRINILNALAEKYRYSNPEKIYQYSHSARAKALTKAFAPGLTRSMYNLAIYYETYRNEDSLQYYFEKSLHLSDSLGDKKYHTLTMNSRGLYLVSKRRFEEAVNIFYDVLRSHEEAGNPYGEMAALNNIGLVFMELRQYAKAISNFKKALPKIPEPHPVVLNNIGSCYGSLSRYDSAEYFVTWGIERARATNNLHAEANGLHILGTVYESADDYDRALEMFLTAEKIREKVPGTAMQIADLTNISNIYAKLKNPSKGIEYGNRALKLAEDDQVDYKIENIYEALALNYEAAGNFQRATELYRKWGVEKDSSYAKAQSEALAEMQTKYETEKKVQQIQIRDLQLAEQALLIQQKNLQLYAFIGGVVVLLILLYLGYNRLKLQRRVQQLELVQKIQSERERISSDLHDHVGAQLTSILSGLQITDQIEGFRKDEEVQKIVSSLKADAQDTLTSLRDSIWSLHQSEITLADFIDHIEKYLTNAIKYNSSLSFEIINHIAYPYKLASREALNITRVVQESIQNIAKHAEARHIIVDLSLKESLVIKISDDGVGFDTEAMAKGEHYGIENMKRRMEEIGGGFSISSVKNQGSTISLTI
ncbi:ATP-binding protein [uncultured Imperialibacter sp.]|uniref:ATP-binding protein n=1 Tax=uncultured Imperialibacter sp. TaxID=1672639 RepID=UPI0030D90456|tara:strand:- start:83412 stop:85307 length:1896 start_codon:yes stop_codon:yes gene_type:complete